MRTTYPDARVGVVDFLNAIFPAQSDDLVMKLSYERFVLKELKQRNMHGVSLSW